MSIDLTGKSFFFSFTLSVQVVLWETKSSDKSRAEMFIGDGRSIQFGFWTKQIRMGKS
jgi:hypothetical protein